MRRRRGEHGERTALAISDTEQKGPLTFVTFRPGACVAPRVIERPNLDRERDRIRALYLGASQRSGLVDSVVTSRAVMPRRSRSSSTTRRLGVIELHEMELGGRDGDGHRQPASAASSSTVRACNAARFATASFNESRLSAATSSIPRA